MLFKLTKSPVGAFFQAYPEKTQMQYAIYFNAKNQMFRNKMLHPEPMELLPAKTDEGNFANHTMSCLTNKELLLIPCKKHSKKDTTIPVLL